MRYSAALVVAAFVPQLACATADTAAETPWATNDLEKLLVAAANDRNQSPPFLHALMTQDVCALADKDSKSTDAAGRVKLVAIQTRDGQTAMPVFTAPQRVATIFGTGAPVVCAKGDVLLPAFRGNNVVLDAGQPYGIVWTTDEFTHVIGTERTVQNPTDVQISEPKDPPVALIARLRAVFEAEPDVSGAWLALAYWPSTKESSWLFDVHTRLEREKILAMLRDATSGVSMDGKPLDLIIHDTADPPGTGIVIVQH